jgi:predicted ATPase
VYSCMSASASERDGNDMAAEMGEWVLCFVSGARIEDYTALVTAELGRQERIVPIPRPMPHLRSISKQPPASERAERFPFTVPVVRELDKLSLDAAVTFLVGENGSGKSTLLEALAAATGLPAIGTLNVADDATLEAQRALGSCLKLVWRRRTRRGFFLRAEDFFGFTKTIARMRADFLARLDEIDVAYQNRSAYAKGFARMPFVNSLADMERRYGIDLDANSHGQSFLRLFSSRFVPGGLYLLDEPEAPLSPQSQLALIAMINEMVAQDAQFVIATHSPILLALPGALIYSCDRVPMRPMQFDELEHVVLTRDFLNDPERFLRHLR